MRNNRFFYHPMVQNKYSFKIFLFYSTVAICLSLFMSWKLNNLFFNAGVDLNSQALQLSTLETIFFSFGFQFVVVMLAGLFAAGLVAKHIIGPTKRIEKWLMDWKRGKKQEKLKIRINDKYDNMVFLINALYERKHKKMPNSTKEGELIEFNPQKSPSTPSVDKDRRKAA